MATLPGQMMMVKVRANRPTAHTTEDHNDGGILIGSEVRMPGKPFEIDAKKAEELIKLGLVDVCVELPRKERAIDPKLEAQRR